MYVFINLMQRYNKFVNEIILYEESFIYLAFLPVFYIHCGMIESVMWQIMWSFIGKCPYDHSFTTH